MKSTNIPEVKLGIVAVSRDCFPIQLSEKRRAAIVAACQAKGLDLYEAKTTVENEKDMEKAVAEVTEAGCNALTVFLGNFGPETPETLIAKFFNGPCMFVAAAEGDGDMINGRGDAYCGMLNCSYNLGMRHLKGYIPEYPIGTADEIADKMIEFVPIARTLLGVRDLKIITFGPRPQDFFACNAPIKGLYELGVEVEENSELDLLVSYKEHANDPRIEDVCKDMAAEMGEGHYYPDLLARMAQFELTLLDWADAHKGNKKYVAFADKCWPAFPSQFGFEPCYVNSRLVSRGIPVSCEVDIYGALSEYIGMCASGDTVTLLDINNSVPQYIYDEDIAGKFETGELWTEIFTDPILQGLIRQGLENNSDLQSAMLQVEAAQASFRAAQLAFLPSLNLAPQGGVSSFDGSKATWTYNVPVTASWEIDIFGRVLNSKRNAKA